MITPHDAPPDLAAAERYRLTLFVNGASDLSARAIDAVTHVCDAHLRGRCHLEVVDVHVQPDVALRNCVRVVPTLVRTSPLPVRRLAGDLSQERVLPMLMPLDGAETATP
jgi:circadian clock protein KaiB